jgi:pyruvate/2-oxoglutarate dehydrogenase complex dihydrolipoamide acyltransferase (E2) component
MKKTKMNNVNHPQHYANNGYGVEAIEIMRRVFGDADVTVFCKLNAFKYRLRAGRKEGSPAAQDLEKEQWYLAKLRDMSAAGAADAAAAAAPEDKPAPKAAPARRGRKNRWTPEQKEQLFSMNANEAAAHFGITIETVRTLRWKLRKERGEDDSNSQPTNALNGYNL